MKGPPTEIAGFFKALEDQVRPIFFTGGLDECDGRTLGDVFGFCERDLAVGGF
jgi:hypothetical protein